MGYFVDKDKMECLFSALSKKYRIYAPKHVGKFIRYGEIQSYAQIEYKEKSHFSPKEVFYPIVQTLLYFTKDECVESTLADEREILLFVRPCDIHGIHRLDTIFLENGGKADNFYERLRQKIKFVMMECIEGFGTCFCVSMGTNKSEDYHGAIRFAPNGLYVDIKDQSLISFFEDAKVCEFKPDYIHKNQKSVQIPKINDRSMLKEIQALDYWRGFDEKCIGCGGCNTVCVTCSCFDTADIIYDETSRDGERRRIWSSCMLKDFTTMAGGHGVRSLPGDRMRFKTMHKVYDFKYRFGKENMCVGCGRCDMRCPKDICFSDTISGLAQEVEKLQRGKEAEQ